jgi:ParB family transcriptional regulator, chromosome partitioning protein
VEALMESIAVLGLIQPIAVDSQGVLLAGGHRREAIERLQTANPAAFAEHFSAGVPVRSYDFDSAEDLDWALATEMRELADHLKAGATPLLPSLAMIVGKSERQMKTQRNYHAPPDGDNVKEDPVKIEFRCFIAKLQSFLWYPAPLQQNESIG